MCTARLFLLQTLFFFHFTRRLSSLFVLASRPLQLHGTSVLSDSRLKRPVISSTPIIPIIRDPAAAAGAPNNASYVESSLADVDLRAYASAGILLYDFKRVRGGDRPVLRLLMGSNHEKKTEFLGGKKEAEDADVYATAAREFDEESGGILSLSAGDVSHRATLERACRGSKVLW